MVDSIAADGPPRIRVKIPKPTGKTVTFDKRLGVSEPGGPAKREMTIHKKTHRTILRKNKEVEKGTVKRLELPKSRGPNNC